MANAEKIVDYVSGLLSNLIPKPADAILKPLIKPVGDNLKAWLSEKETQKALFEAAQNAESDFREQAKEKFGNDKLTQAVASFPMHNGELFQAALQSLPSHFNETFLANHISNDLSKYWSGEFTLAEIQAGTALYIDCLRVRLLRVNGFADIVTRLAILRTDRRTEDILEIVKEILSLLSELLKKDGPANVLRSLHQLPPAPADFTGREAIIADILNDFDGHKGATISGLTGMGGIGKTALGLAVAHQIAEKYPDAQIFLDLKGTTTPLSATDIMRHVILSFEPTADLRALDDVNMPAVYQSVLYGKKVLLFLDNAFDANQVKSMIPPESCALLATSRRTFSVAGLKAHKVDVLEENETIDFLLELCPRINDRAAELAKACAYLPLALRIAGSFLRVNEDWPIKKYLSQLIDRKQRLITLKESREEAELTTEADLLATFELSYNQLLEEDQKCWRMLGVFTTSFSWNAAAFVWSSDEMQSRKLLSLFSRYSLLEFNESTTRYILHDLLIDFAIEKLNLREVTDTRFRYAQCYLNALNTANSLYAQGGSNILIGLQVLDREWEHINNSRDWAVENSNLNSNILLLVDRYPLVGHFVLPLRLSPRAHIQWLLQGISAAESLEKEEDKSHHLVNLGNAYLRTGQLHEAIDLYEQQLIIVHKLGNRNSEGITLGSLGTAFAQLGKYEKAAVLLEQQLILMRETGDRRGVGHALGNLGNIYKALGEIHKAINYYEEDLQLAQEIGDKHGEMVSLGSLGIAYASSHDYEKAMPLFEQQFIIACELGDKHGEGMSLAFRGYALTFLGQTDVGIEMMRQAISILNNLESPDVQWVRERLNELGM